MEGDVQLDEGRAAHAVDEGEDLVAAGQVQVGDDRRDEPLGHLVDRREPLPSAPRLAMDADPDFDLVVAELEGRSAGGRDDT